MSGHPSRAGCSAGQCSGGPASGAVRPVGQARPPAASGWIAITSSFGAPRTIASEGPPLSLDARPNPLAPRGGPLLVGKQGRAIARRLRSARRYKAWFSGAESGSGGSVRSVIRIETAQGTLAPWFRRSQDRRADHFPWDTDLEILVDILASSADPDLALTGLSPWRKCRRNAAAAGGSGSGRRVIAAGRERSLGRHLIAHPNRLSCWPVGVRTSPASFGRSCCARGCRSGVTASHRPIG